MAVRSVIYQRAWLTCARPPKEEEGVGLVKLLSRVGVALPPPPQNQYPGNREHHIASVSLDGVQSLNRTRKKCRRLDKETV